ncbi:MAG: lipopolysaccharide biosynthesis protein [Prevotella sp.]|nr:lipopolysaccharide biosynthesis protein [Prevotella sp.]
MTNETLKEKTAKGLFWGGLNSLTQQVIGVIFAIILGRLLDNADFGMIAMISVFSLIATTLQNSGFPTALANMKEPHDNDYNSVFWFNIIVGFSAYTVLFFCAPLIADYYNEPRLIPLCRYAFLSILIASFGTAQNAFLFKNLRAKQQAKAAMVAVLIASSTGVACAFAGLAYWSLATQGLVYVSINTLLAWHYSPWRPSLKNITFEPAKRMFRFSFKILLSNITTIINNNILNFLLGHYFTARDTGNYNQAYQWNSKCFSLVQSMVNQVAQPVLVDLQNEGERQLNAFRKMMRFAAFLSFPLLLGFGLVAKEFIVLTVGPKWIVSVGYVQILCFAGATMPLSTLLSNMVISKGKSNLYLYCILGLGIIQIITMLLLWPYGIKNMVIAYTLINITWVFVWLFFVNRLTSYGLWFFIKDTTPFALAAFAVMAATHFATASIHTLWLLLICRIAMAMLLYYAVMRMARVQILAECQQFIIKKFHSR